MSELMFCEHPEAQVRLVAWATDCKGQHEQGFSHKYTCTSCGQVVKGVVGIDTYIVGKMPK